MFLSSFLPENPGELQEPVRRVASALNAFKRAWSETFFEQTLKNPRDFLTTTSEKHVDLTRRLDAQNPAPRVDLV
jgi:hypothetical protein